MHVSDVLSPEGDLKINFKQAIAPYVEGVFDCSAYKKAHRKLFESLVSQGECSVLQERTGDIICSMTQIRTVRYKWCKHKKRFFKGRVA